MNTLRKHIATALIRLGKWIQPELEAGPIGEDPK